MNNIEKMNFDAIVVGTGPGGGTVARELSKRKKKVLILEWGPGDPIRGTFRQYLREQLIPGKSLLITNKFLGMVRGITTGGSSLFYYGTAFPVPFEMLKSYGVDIRREVAEAKKELPVGTLKDEMITPMTQRLMESAQDLGYNWKKLDKFMYQERWRPEFKFGYYGDPNGVKWSARMFVEEAVGNGSVLLNGAKVSRVIIENGKATGVEFRMKGRDYRAFASKIIIAAGGIGSPVILRRSGIKEAGYNFFFDPLITACGTVQDVRKRINEIPMSTGVHLQDEGYMMTDMAVPALIDAIFTAQVFRFHRLFTMNSTLRIMIKARDTLGGRITDSGGVRKKLIKDDQRKLLKGYERAREILRNAGAKDIYRTWYLAAHPGGTVKIGELVDAHLKTQFDNLYVCDCSVVPEAWGLPPTLTLVGLGKYLARHLAADKKKPEGQKRRKKAARK